MEAQRHYMNSDDSIPNDVYSNCIQMPALLVSIFVMPSLKRNCCVEDHRSNTTWRYDTYRITVTNIIGFSVLLSIAMMFQGNDMVNLYTLAAVDLTIGIGVDILLLRALRVGGMPIGYYGSEPDYTRFVWNTMTTVAIAITARCTTAIAAIFMFPFVNDAYENHVIQVSVHVTALVLPFVYFSTRIMLTDRYHQHANGYAKASDDAHEHNDVGKNQVAECPIAIAGDSDDNEDLPDGADVDEARDAHCGEEPAARDGSTDD